MAVYRIGDKDGCHQLVANSPDGDADNGGYIPLAILGFLGADEEDDDADNGTGVAQVAEPKSELWLWFPLHSFRPHVHPKIG